MKELKIPLSDEIIKKINLFSEIDWIEVAKKAIVDKLTILQYVERLAADSKLTKEDVEELSDKINSSGFKRFIS